MTNKLTSLVDLPDPSHMERALHARQTVPSMAMIFHTRDRSSLSALTIHQIAMDAKKRPMLMPGHPLNSEDEREILQLLRPGHVSDTFTVNPPELLYVNADCTMWWLPPSRRAMALRTEADLQPIVRRVIWPNLVLMASQRRLYVIAVPGKERPTADTPCFFAPVGNVWVSTELCTGNVTLPATCDVASISAWNRVLCDSAFTHANADKVIKAPGRAGRHVDPMDYWRSTPVKHFPDNQLVPTRFPLRDWIEYTRAVERRR